MIERLKLKKKRLKGLLFFLFAFTLAIFTFSVGKSATDSQSSRYLKYNPEYNKVLNFQGSKGYTIEMLQEDLKDKKISITLIKRQDMGKTKIKTYMKTDGIFIDESMVSGKGFTKENFIENGNKAVVTTAVSDEERSIEWYDQEGKKRKTDLDIVGESYDKEGFITISYPMFKEMYGDVDINDPSLTIVMSGYDFELKVARASIEKTISGLGFLKVEDYVPYDTSDESSVTGGIVFLVISITIVNSIGISTIWVESRKKEIIMRKIMGATDFNISLLFFGELSIICGGAIVLALLAQMILSSLTNGVVMNLDLTMRASNVVFSIIFTVVMAICIAVPFLSDLKKVQPIEIIRED